MALLVQVDTQRDRKREVQSLTRYFPSFSASSFVSSSQCAVSISISHLSHLERQLELRKSLTLFLLTAPSFSAHPQPRNPFSPRVDWLNLAEPHKEVAPSDHTITHPPSPLPPRLAPTPPSLAATLLQLHPHLSSRQLPCWGVRSRQQQLPQGHAVAKACWHPEGSRVVPSSMFATNLTALITSLPSTPTSTSV